MVMIRFRGLAVVEKGRLGPEDMFEIVFLSTIRRKELDLVMNMQLLKYEGLIPLMSACTPDPEAWRRRVDPTMYVCVDRICGLIKESLRRCASSSSPIHALNNS